MNYQKIYQNLIERAKNRKLAGYKEVHHIVPRCLGGSNNAENLIDLTPEEHYVAHQLLVKIYPNNEKLLYAAIMMCSNRVNNKLYGWLRRKMSGTQSVIMTGSGNNMFNKRWVSNELETKLVSVAESTDLVNSGKYIVGKIATKAPCGCLVKKRCIVHENKKELSYQKKRIEFSKQATELFNEFLNSEIKSITQFAKLKNTSQPALTQFWKKHVPDYSLYVKHGKSFKKSLTQ